MASTVSGALIMAAVGYFLFEGSDELAEPIEQWAGVDTPEEDEDNDIDSTLQALSIVAGFYLGVQSGGYVLVLAENARGVGQSMTENDLLERAPSEEFAADEFAVALILRAGYSALAADFVLSASASQQFLPTESQRGARAAFGSLGQDNSRSEWSHILLGYEHPGLEERRARIQRLIDVVDPVEPQDIALCSADGGRSLNGCESWIVAARQVATAPVRFLDIADHVANARVEEAREGCAEFNDDLREWRRALGHDRTIARTALASSLLCPTNQWADLALPLIEQPGLGGYDFLRDLTSVLAAKGQSAFAYDFSGRMGSRAAGNAITFADFAHWSTSMGFHDLADRALAACTAGSRNYLVADSGEFCRDVMSRARDIAPDHGPVVYQTGLTIRQRLVALWNIALFRQALLQTNATTAQMNLLRTSLFSSFEMNDMESDGRWCLPHGEIDPYPILTGRSDLISWRHQRSRCIEAATIDGPARWMDEVNTRGGVAEMGEANDDFFRYEPILSTSVQYEDETSVTGP